MLELKIAHSSQKISLKTHTHFFFGHELSQFCFVFKTIFIVNYLNKHNESKNYVKKSW